MSDQPPAAQGKPATPPNAPPPGKSEEPAGAATQPDKDPMRELLERMERLHPLLVGADPSLARTMESLVQRARDSETHGDPAFRHQVAYALQDLEKSPIGPIALGPELRSELNNLAGTAPGLQNERMQALMRATASLEDKVLVREIRNVGVEVGRQAKQDTPDVESRIDVLENKLRLAQRAAAPQYSRETGNRAEHASEPTTGETRPGPDPAAGNHQPTPDEVANAARHLGGAARNHSGPAAAGQRPQVAFSRPSLDTLLAAMRSKDHGTAAPWDPPLTPIADRLSAFEKRMQEGADERAFMRAERSARATLEALQAFRTGQGAAVMNRIHEAARSEPGGMAGVLSEMRRGGRFADLRQQFNNALETERGVAGVYDRATAALARYAQDRTAVQDIIGRRPDADALTARFEQMDARIGEAATSTPSRRDGKSMIDDLAEKAAELLRRAVDAVKSVFSRSHSAEASARASPSPSISA